MLAGVPIAVAACGSESVGPTQVAPSSRGGRSPDPIGLVAFNDQPWNGLTTQGWSYLRRTSSKDADIISDATAPSHRRAF